MQKVITINLNGNAYHLEEQGYEAMRAYLDGAIARLKDNPDRDEIVADLEQAIAEKCAAYLGTHKTVVSSSEVAQVLREMGPVTDPDPATSGAGGSAADDKKASTPGDAPRRLYQIHEGAMITGVCNGLAAYLGIDVTLVRVIFVALTVLTKGAWIVVYGVLALILPVATTAEERAAAQGLPFNAQELIDRTKENYRRQQRHWARQWRRSHRPPIVVANEVPRRAEYATQIALGALAPLFAILQAAAFVLLILAIISLVNTEAVFGWELPEEVPLWLGILGLIAIYHMIMGPLRAAMFRPVNPPAARDQSGPQAWAGALSFAFTFIGLWLVYSNVPEVREFVHALPTMLQEVWERVSR